MDHPKYYQKALSSRASFVIIDEVPEELNGKTLLVHKRPFQAFNTIINHYFPFRQLNHAIHESLTIGENCIVQPGVVIGENVEIGHHCIIHPNVTIYGNVKIGNNVIIHANTVIGSDAFYYNRKDTYHKFNSCGDVVIEDKVEIGASCTIDRGVTGPTIIGEGSKLDNQVHVGHDVRIGSNCLIAAQTGIAGICTIKDRVTIWGQVGISSNITIESDVVILAQSGVSKNLKSGKTYFGSPAEEARKKFKELAKIKQLTSGGG